MNKALPELRVGLKGKKNEVENKSHKTESKKTSWNEEMIIESLSEHNDLHPKKDRSKSKWFLKCENTHNSKGQSQENNPLPVPRQIWNEPSVPFVGRGSFTQYTGSSGSFSSSSTNSSIVTKPSFPSDKPFLYGRHRKKMALQDDFDKIKNCRYLRIRVPENPTKEKKYTLTRNNDSDKSISKSNSKENLTIPTNTNTINESEDDDNTF